MADARSRRCAALRFRAGFAGGESRPSGGVRIGEPREARDSPRRPRAGREIADNKAQLEAIIGQPLESFAYPNGKPFRDYNASHIAMLRACGYRYALSTSPGTATRATSVYQLPRFTPWDRTQLKYLTRMLRNYRSDAEQVPETAAATAA